MWNYEKRLEYPINIKETNPKIAKFIMSQYGGPDCTSLSPVCFPAQNMPCSSAGHIIIAGP